MTSSKKMSIRILSLVLSLVLTVGLLVPGIRQAGAEALSGHWEKVSFSNGSRNISIHALVLDNPVRNCSSFDLDVEISMKANTHCYNWQIWLGKNGDYTQAGTLYLPGGDGSTSTTVRLSPSKDFDSVVVAPTATGGYSWSMYFEISNVSGRTVDSGYTQPTESAEPSYFLPATWEKVRINDIYVHALVFDNPIRRCTQLSLAADIEMHHNTSCKTWKIWGGYNGSFSELGTLSLPGGNGEGYTTLYFKSPKNLDSIAITPVSTGGFSWTMSLGVYDVITK